MENEEYLKAWSIVINSVEDMEEAIYYLRKFSEESIILRKKIRMEIHIPKFKENAVSKPLE